MHLTFSSYRASEADGKVDATGGTAPVVCTFRDALPSSWKILLSAPATTLICPHGQRTGSPSRTTLRPWQLIRLALLRILNAPLQLPHVALSPSMATCLPLSNIVDVTAMTSPLVVVLSLSLTAARRMVDSRYVQEAKRFADSTQVDYWMGTNFCGIRDEVAGRHQSAIPDAKWATTSASDLIQSPDFVIGIAGTDLKRRALSVHRHRTRALDLVETHARMHAAHAGNPHQRLQQEP
ncbi:hypothetical protein BME24068_00249 [Burkholderia metallica]|nr:hypothetical protein BME24068_00249 [Burkholderia metallica]